MAKDDLQPETLNGPSYPKEQSGDVSPLNLSAPDATVAGMTRGTRIVDNRLMDGLMPDGSYGMRVSKPGYDVKSATNDQLIFNSSQNVFKIVSTGTSLMPIATATMTAAVMSFGSATTAIPHGLSYTPVVIGFITALGGSSLSNPLPFLNNSGGILGGSTFQDIQTYQVQSDSTNIYLFSTIQVWWSTATTRNDSTANWSCKYYTLQETAN